MDPNSNLDQQLNLAAAILDENADVEVRILNVMELAELVLALDEWIAGGGAPPKRWA